MSKKGSCAYAQPCCTRSSWRRPLLCAAAQIPEQKRTDTHQSRHRICAITVASDVADTWFPIIGVDIAALLRAKAFIGNARPDPSVCNLRRRSRACGTAGFVKFAE